MSRKNREPQRVRVVVWLDPSVLERLEIIVRDKPGGPRTRSAVVREACMWLMAKEAAWLVRREQVQADQQRRAREDADALATARAERERGRDLDVVAQALDIARRRIT